MRLFRSEDVEAQPGARASRTGARPLKKIWMLWAGMAALLALAVVALSPAAETPPSPARTPLPTWTLPFSLVTDTPAPARELPTRAPTEAPLEPTSTPAAAATPEPTTEHPTPTPVVPPRLIIPALKLDQDIIPVAIVDNNWDLTALGEKVGWLTTTGEHPGDARAMTLVGHVTISFAQSGPFIDLDRLKAGDEVIYRWNGMDYRYRVEGTTMTDPEDVSQMYVPDGTRLLLVTCSKWSWFAQHYTRRTIVTAELMGLQPSP